LRDFCPGEGARRGDAKGKEEKEERGMQVELKRQWIEVKRGRKEK